MASNDGEDKFSSERWKNLSEEQRKLLKILLERQHATPRNETRQAPEGDPPNSDRHRSRQNPWEDPRFSAFHGQSGPNPWLNFWDNAFNQGWGSWGNPRWNAWHDRRSGQSGGAPPDSTLVAMKSSGSQPPFFCVHAIFGSAFPYFNLATHMEEDQPFYGLQSPGLDGAQPPLDRIEAMAALYNDAIRSVQPQGPYYLGGYSFGSWVAFEMAQQLIQAGEKTALLAMIGTGLPISMTNPPLFKQMEFLIDYFEDYRRLVLNSMLSDQYRMAMDQPGMPPSLLSPLHRVVQANSLAQLRYIPRPYSAKITVFMTLEQQALLPPDSSMGWNMLSVEDVDSTQVPGNHLNMFYEPHVIELADKLTLCLRAARNPSENP